MTMVSSSTSFEHFRALDRKIRYPKKSQSKILATEKQISLDKQVNFQILQLPRIVETDHYWESLNTVSYLFWYAFMARN